MRLCPLLREPCKKDKCMWYLAEGRCAIPIIAICLDTLRTGVPIVRVVDL